MRKSGAPGGQDKTFSFWLAVAAGIHVVVLFGLVGLQSLNRVQSFKPRVVSVSLLSLPGTGGSSEKAGKKVPAAAKPAPRKPAAKKVPEPAPAPVPKPKAAKKVPVEPASKPKPVKPKKEDALASALDRLKKGVEQKKSPSADDNLKSALSRLKAGAATSASGTGGEAAGSGTKGAGSGTGGLADPYKAAVAGIIQENWEFSGSLLRNTSGMEVYVRIRVQANGTIAQIVFDQRSPSEYLNNSVKKALEKSSPLPQFPPEYGSPQEWIGFVFTPSGIEQ
ncbi:energy transducer TonB [Chlorobium phaeovibrioides]|uniref:TonB family protein n=1 Tax=Chlorobium phaeovibrioides TaxID=1094 RepID=A0ABW9UPY7_CHLPH|nr:energy transducer TonB [Chlorobium phaeovibrioides]MWV53992.1 TonB family protein [Chlorobium phaeovibrioides]